MIHEPLSGQGTDILFTATLVLAVPTQRASNQGTISQLSFLVYLPLPTVSLRRRNSHKCNQGIFSLVKLENS